MSSEESGPPPVEGPEGSGEMAIEKGPFGGEWDRRSLFKGAALGTAAAAMYTGGRMAFGPLTAFGNDLSHLPCTAQDVTVDPTAFVVNEPCTCPGVTFNATVAFTVTNHTGTSRYCVTLHIPSGFGVPAQDVVLSGPNPNGEIKSGETLTMTGVVTGFPCNAGGTQICIGAPGSDGRKKCDPNTCLTVAWNTSPNATCPDTSPPGGQCRHQRICIQGFGISVECATGACAVRNLTSGCCAVDCGASLNVKITAAGQSGEPCSTPLTISVKRPGETVFTNVTLTGGCYVDPNPVQGTYTFRATDCHGCFREDTLEVCVTQIEVGAPIRVDNPCDGVVTFRAGPVTGGTGTVSYSFSLDGGAAVPGTGTNGDEFVYSPSLAADGGLDTSCHSLTVTASIGSGCADTSPATTFSQCVSTTTGCTP
jgi:hypothetical protein